MSPGFCDACIDGKLDVKKVDPDIIRAACIKTQMGGFLPDSMGIHVEKHEVGWRPVRSVIITDSDRQAEAQQRFRLAQNSSNN